MLALHILHWVNQLNIDLTCTHLAGVQNVISDQLSQTEIHSGIILQVETSAIFHDQLGLCAIDALASGRNTKLPRFFTQWPRARSRGCQLPGTASEPAGTIWCFLTDCAPLASTCEIAWRTCPSSSGSITLPRASVDSTPVLRSIKIRRA